MALSRRFSFSIFGCLKQYISGISCGWILKDVFQHSNEPEKWFTNEGKRKWRCWRSFIVFTKFILDLSDIAWVALVTDQLKRQGRGQVTLLLSSFFTFTAHIKLVSLLEKVLSTVHTFPCNISHQIFEFLWGGFLSMLLDYGLIKTAIFRIWYSSQHCNILHLRDWVNSKSDNMALLDIFFAHEIININCQ